LSHEFFIQNHADIVSCIAMVFVIGLMVQVRLPINRDITIHRFNSICFVFVRSKRGLWPTRYKRCQFRNPM